MKELLLRLTMPMNNFWKKFQRLSIALAVAVPTTNQLAEYYKWVPEGFVPEWLKGLIGGMIMMGTILPHLTVKNHDELAEKLK